MKILYKPKRIKYFMNVAKLTANESYSEKLKVGVVAVRENRIVATGYNGTPPGASNICETVAEKRYVKFSDWQKMLDLKDGWRPSLEDIFTWERLTAVPDLIHAEHNLILFAEAHNIDLASCDLFQTIAPCAACASRLHDVGVRTIFYLEDYKNTGGIDFSEEMHIERVTT